MRVLGLVLWRPYRFNSSTLQLFNASTLQRLTRRTHRQHHSNCGSIPRLALSLGASTMQLGDMFHNRQPQAGAPQFAAASFVSAIKALENSRQMLFADPES